MRSSGGLQKLIVFVFIATSVLLILTGAIWGFRRLAVSTNQTSTQAIGNTTTGIALKGSLAPDFKLVNQFGKPVALSSLRGQEVVLAFIDARCTTLCPLTAETMYNARTKLGTTAAKQVMLVAVNANPTATSVSEVQAWSIQHGMLHQWQFLTGTAQELKAVYQLYKVYDQVNPDGSIEHDPTMLIIDEIGRAHV